MKINEEVILADLDRDHTIRVLEEAAQRPISKFYTLALDWDKAYGSDALEESPSNPPVQPLRGEVLKTITAIYRTDDTELRQNALLLVRASLRCYVINLRDRFKINIVDPREYVSAAHAVIAEDLQYYDSTKGTLTTFYAPRLKKAMCAINQEATGAGSSRYSKLREEIERAQEALRLQENGESTPKQFSI